MAVQFQMVGTPEASPGQRRRAALRTEHSREAATLLYGVGNPPDHFRKVIDYLNTKQLGSFQGRSEQGQLFVTFKGTDIAMFTNGTYYTTGARTIVSLRQLERSSNSLGQVIGDEILSHPAVSPLVGTVGSGTLSKQ